MFDFKLEFPEEENPFENFVSDYELIKVMYSDKINIKTENYTDKLIKFQLNLSHEIQVDKNVTEIARNLKFNSLILEDNLLAIPYRIEFSFSQDNQKDEKDPITLLEGKMQVFWLKKKTSELKNFEELFIKSIEIQDSAIIYNIVENLKNWLKQPEMKHLLIWVQMQHEEKVICISSDLNFLDNDDEGMDNEFGNEGGVKGKFLFD